MARLLVATTLRVERPEFDDENRATADALADLGLRPELHPWHTGIEAWLEADLVLVRTTWDYPAHLEDFERWLDVLEGEGVPVINPIRFLRWNLRKSYLLDLEAEGVAIVPTEIVAAGSHLDGADHLRVVKPLVGVGGIGTRLVPEGESTTVEIDALVNPFLPRVAEGELSIFMVEGEPVQAFRKVPDGDDFRAHPQWGGKYFVDGEPDVHALAEARRVYEAADRLNGGGLVYVRVDLLQDDDGRWLVLEAEGLEPSLYTDVDTTVVKALASAVSRHLPEV